MCPAASLGTRKLPSWVQSLGQHHSPPHAHTHAHTGMHTCTHLHVRTLTCTHMHTHVHLHACAHSYILTCTHTYMCTTHAALHTHTCAHTHTICPHPLSGWLSPQLTPEMLQSSVGSLQRWGAALRGLCQQSSFSRDEGFGSGRLRRLAELEPEGKGSSLLPPFTHPALMRLCESSALADGLRRDGQRERRAPDEAKINGQSWP